MDKKALTETDIRTRYITPGIVGSAGEKWDVMTQLRQEVYFTKGFLPLIDRNLLAEQARTKGFKPFGTALTTIAALAGTNAGATSLADSRSSVLAA